MGLMKCASGRSARLILAKVVTVSLETIKITEAMRTRIDAT